MHPRDKVFTGKVLLAEDNLVNRKLILACMKKIGVPVTCAGNGQEVLEMVGKDDFDLILMDLQMPKMGGVAATRVLREQGQNMPIVALTANAQEEDKVTCLNNGFDQYFVKPIELESFYQMLGKYLDLGTMA